MTLFERVMSVIAEMRCANDWWVNNRVLVNLAKSGIMGFNALLTNTYVRHARLATMNITQRDDQIANENLRESQSVAFANEFIGLCEEAGSLDQINAADQVNFYWTFAFDPTAPLSEDEQEKVKLIALMKDISEDEVRETISIEKKATGNEAQPYKAELTKRTKALLHYDPEMVFDPTDMQVQKIAQKLHQYTESKLAYIDKEIEFQSLYITRLWTSEATILKTLVKADSTGVLDILVSDIHHAVEAAREEQTDPVDHGGPADTASRESTPWAVEELGINTVNLEGEEE